MVKSALPIQPMFTVWTQNTGSRRFNETKGNCLFEMERTMAKMLPPLENGMWPNLVAAFAFMFSRRLKKYVRDLEEFRDVHRFD